VRPTLHWCLALVFLLLLFADFRLALPGYRHSFPRDHFEHRDFRTEWWYYTGNLRTDAGRRYGFELVFFRQGRERAAADPSAWRIDDLYLAHLALSDLDGRRFLHHRRLNRAGPGIAGAAFAERRVWNGNWSARWDGDTQVLDAVAEGIRFSLRLTPAKPPVVHGENGVSQKAPGPGRASCYVSFTRLLAEGTLNGDPVHGTAWMDHEWFTNQLAPHQVGWDWFSAQFDDGTELMLFQLRNRGGGIDPYSSGTFVDARGKSRHLRSSEFTLTPLDWWTSPKTGARYPIRWRIAALGRTFECAAQLPDQELAGEGLTYWEGAVAYRGGARGAGYLEMTGYDKPVRMD